jgi:hypothetical protein
MLDRQNCNRHQHIRQYSHLQEAADNIPYVLMGLLGAAILAQAWGGWAAVMYLAYCVAGAVWIICFVCPHCQYYATRSCPCGYGQIAARWVTRKSDNQFARQFRRHIPVIVPLWFIPVVAALMSRDRQMLLWLAAFVADAYVVLPLTARLYGCGHCPQKSDCPWMLRKGAMDP